MGLRDDSVAKLQQFLSAHYKSPVDIKNLKKLSGGAIQENWGFQLIVDEGPCKGCHDLVLRCDAPSSVSASHSRASEYTVLRAAYDAGVRVPEPYVVCTDHQIFGVDFFIMARMAGVAHGHIITRGPAKPELAYDLGRQLAKIHSLKPGLEDLNFLGPVDDNPALSAIKLYRSYLDETGWPYPALEWGLKWLENHAPKTPDPVLCHRDFRTGNYLVDDGKLSAILDWEFSGWGDRLEDIGWFTARCWRFKSPVRSAGGISEAKDFYRGYEYESGYQIDKTAVFYWQVMAHVRWAVIAVQQNQRHVSGVEPSLELALTGHVVPELEWQILTMIKNSAEGK